MSYDNTNKGALFKNTRKEGEKHPDYRGEINVNGVDLEIAAWLRESKKGQKYLSLSVGPKWQGSEKAPNAGMETQSDDFNDEIPF